MAGAVTVKLEGLAEKRKQLRQAGASLEAMQPEYEKAAKIVQQAAIREAPHRSGRLQSAVITTATKSDGKVIGLASVPYMGVIHFGWVTRNALGVRGQNRKLAQARYEGVLSKRTVNKALAGSKRRVNRKTGVTRGAVRGGPIRPQPFIYQAAGDPANVAAVHQVFDEKAADIAKAAS